MSDLFDFAKIEKPQSESAQPTGPLAHRMRPTMLSEFYGHDQIVGAGKPLRMWIESDQVPSLILWGPPGCGKTTLAQLIAKQTSARFENLSAVQAGIKEIKEIAQRAKETLRYESRKTILFLDEIHRFNKSQQDALLPHVEDGTLILIGATTENPSFELNYALLSRARVIRFEAPSQESILKALSKALIEPVRGLGGLFDLEVDALQWLAEMAQGDVRKSLGSLEIIALGVRGAGLTGQTLGCAQVQGILEAAGGRQPIAHDKKGEYHYDVVSALIKSMRASDPDAALYYLARMLEGGDDPMFIVRRLVIFASEDIGNIDPRALMIASSAQQSVHLIGMPEARIVLAQAVAYLACALKSRSSYDGIEAALAEVRKSGALPVPFHLRNTRVTGDPTELESGKINSTSRSVSSSRLPSAIVGRRFYNPPTRI